MLSRLARHQLGSQWNLVDSWNICTRTITWSLQWCVCTYNITVIHPYPIDKSYIQDGYIAVSNSRESYEKAPSVFPYKRLGCFRITARRQGSKEANIHMNMLGGPDGTSSLISNYRWIDLSMHSFLRLPFKTTPWNLYPNNFVATDS